MKRKLQIEVRGLVQGVFFRRDTQNEALSLGLFGYVKNLEDGRVEIIAEGEEENLKKLIAWLKKGPKFAKVENVETFWSNFEDEFSNFEIQL